MAGLDTYDACSVGAVPETDPFRLHVPERRLLLAILETALDDASRGGAASKGQAQAWLASRVVVPPAVGYVSAAYIGEVFGFPVGHLARILRTGLDGAPVHYRHTGGARGAVDGVMHRAPKDARRVLLDAQAARRRAACTWGRVVRRDYLGVEW